MASSSDWLTQLLERSGSEGVAKPLDWLPDRAKPNEGFVELLPFGRPPPMPEPLPEHEGSTDDDTSDPLEHILQERLAEREEQASEPVPSEIAAQEGPETTPTPDPIKEAFARGEEAGRQEAIAEQEALNQQRVNLRQTFRALDQAAMDALAADLAETVIALCSETLADFIPAPEALKQRCLKAAQRLGSAAFEATLHLHPDDLLLIDKAGIDGWTIVGNPEVERGGLRFETKDGSVSDRPADWRRAIATAIRG